jgi:hypothetical protein
VSLGKALNKWLWDSQLLVTPSESPFLAAEQKLFRVLDWHGYNEIF